MSSTCHIHILPSGESISAPFGSNLLDVLRDAGATIEALCSGKGTCRKCQVFVDGNLQLACQTYIESDIVVLLPEKSDMNVSITELIDMPENSSNPIEFNNTHSKHKIHEFYAAIDIGTTTLVVYLIDAQTKSVVATSSMLNPQVSYGGDVVGRIQAANNGSFNRLREIILETLTHLIEDCCNLAQCTPCQISRVVPVGNSAMQQIFLGMSLENLITIPFSPKITTKNIVRAVDYLPICTNSDLIIVPDIAGYIGSDLVSCLLSTRKYFNEGITLLVDIGTNGEMALGNMQEMVACSTSAGPALEGSNISRGMRAQEGAIDSVKIINDCLSCHVIGDVETIGICGSGLIDAVACALDLGMLDERGRIIDKTSDANSSTPERRIYLTDTVSLTQKDIREVQLAKSAIASGVQIMIDKMNIKVTDIKKVLLAGAFGSSLSAQSACKIGLIPKELCDKITVVGNAAGKGAIDIACEPHKLDDAEEITHNITALELASEPSFSRIFAHNMRFAV